MKEFSRKLRINTQLQQELAVLIRDELGDPRVEGVTVTSADISPDLRQCKVMVSTLGDDAELKEAVAALNHAAGKLRYEIGKRMRLRLVPNLRFVGDVRVREADRISKLIRDAVAEDRSHEPPK
jgi:ribosome-binding factor A